MLTLLALVVVVAGFALRFNPLLIIAAAAITAGLAAGLSPRAVVSSFGHAFNQNRFVSAVWIVLPVVGLLERRGLQARARGLIDRLRGATAGRLLFSYFLLRQLTAALGLAALGGQAQMVRPVVAPMAESAARASRPELTPKEAEGIRAEAAASDNLGVFFGEDIFIAFGSVLLIKASLAAGGLIVSPLSLSLWAIPTALIALCVHAGRMILLDRRLAAGGAKAPNGRGERL
jgi:uncharacterized membrane protein